MTTETGFVKKGVRFTLNGRSVTAEDDETLLQVAQRLGVEVPHLCYRKGLRADGNCRACVVEIEGERVLAASCCRTPTDGMVVHTDSDRSRRAQKLVLELLRSEVPRRTDGAASELDYWAGRLGVVESRFAHRQQPRADLSHPAITVRLEACIQCTRCLRACREEQVNGVIGYAWRGARSAIVFDLEDPLGQSSCVACGECVQACPTGALLPAQAITDRPAERSVDSLCPYCGVGCQLTYHVVMSPAATARPTGAGSASKDATASTMSTIASGSPFP